jgi:hypothetical protein
MKPQQLHSPVAPRRAGLTVAEAMLEIQRRNKQDWIQKIHEIDWSQGINKQWQCMLGFATGAIMGIGIAEARVLLMNMVIYHDGLIAHTEFFRISNWAYDGYMEYSSPQYVLDFKESFALEVAASAQFDGGECDREFLAEYNIPYVSGW